ncbi:MAG: hypothetical protein U9R25_20030 [Chloroflexota bacterium]|nr:hypothetical protein [Chloroflexota bacterium]
MRALISSPQGLLPDDQLVRPAGTVVLKSTYGQPVEADLSQVVVDEICLVGSRCGPFPPALRMLAGGLVDPAALLDAVYSLEQAEAAFELAARPGILKVLLKP